MASRFFTTEPLGKTDYYMILWLIQTMVAHPQLWNFHTSRKELTVSLDYLYLRSSPVFPDHKKYTASHVGFAILLLNWFCSCSVVKSCPTLQPHVLQYARHPCPSLSISRSLLKLMSIESVVPSSHLIHCHSLLLLPSTFLSIRVFFFFPKNWHFASGGQSIGASASVLPMNVHGWFPF